MRVVVIGAGVLGISTAYFLHRHGMDVTVLDSEKGPALGASYGNGGLLQTSAPDPWNGPGVFKIFAKAWFDGLTGRAKNSAFRVQTRAIPGLIGFGLKFLKHANLETYLSHTAKNRRLSTYTRAVLDDLNERESLDYDQSDYGSLMLHRTTESFDQNCEFAAHMAQHGARFESLDRDELLKIEPSLSEIANQLVGAVSFPDDSGGNSRKLCQQLAALLTNRGVIFNYDVSVSSLVKRSTGIAIQTDQGEIVADAVVISAGAGSKKIGASLGINVPIAPAKGYSISVPMEGWTNRPTHIIADMGVHAGANPLGDVLRVAGTAEFAGIRHGISQERTDYLIRLTGQVFPSFAETIDPAEIDPWGGLRPLCADGIPIIGASGIDGVYLNTGHGGVGWTQSVGSGKAVADLIAGIELEVDISDYSLGRFR